MFVLDHFQRVREFFKNHIFPVLIDKIEWPKETFLRNYELKMWLHELFFPLLMLTMLFSEKYFIYKINKVWRFALLHDLCFVPKVGRSIFIKVNWKGLRSSSCCAFSFEKRRKRVQNKRSESIPVVRALLVSSWGHVMWGQG